MPVDFYRNPLTDILFEQASNFMGLYDVDAAWFSRVNTAGYRQLGYPSAQGKRIKIQGIFDGTHRTKRRGFVCGLGSCSRVAPAAD